MKKIVILASGAGTNAENIVRTFNGNGSISVEMLLCDRPEAPVLDKMAALGVKTAVFGRKVWREEPDRILEALDSCRPDLIVLAGFTSIVDARIVGAYPHRIVNIHPSLLPKFGGKGMWGMHVHRAVIDAREKVSGITVHYVSDEIDGGETIAQFSCAVDAEDTPETLAGKIHALEYRHFPEVIASLLLPAGE